MHLPSTDKESTQTHRQRLGAWGVWRSDGAQGKGSRMVGPLYTPRHLTGSVVRRRSPSGFLRLQAALESPRCKVGAPLCPGQSGGLKPFPHTRGVVIRPGEKSLAHSRSPDSPRALDWLSSQPSKASNLFHPGSESPMHCLVHTKCQQMLVGDRSRDEAVNPAGQVPAGANVLQKAAEVQQLVCLGPAGPPRASRHSLQLCAPWCSDRAWTQGGALS